MGFDAYGETRDMPDPVATAVNGILDHIHIMDQRLEDMCKGLKDLGAEVSDLNLPDLGPCALKHVDDREIEMAVAEPEKQAEPEADT
jgi:serine O-acetyltransferase